MKVFLLSIILLLSFQIKAQDISEINKVLEISDTLEFQKEIRIYKDYSIADRITVLRMYDEGKNNWIVTIYYYSKTLKQVTKINEIRFPKENIGKLKPKDGNLIWLNLLLTNVEFLPSMTSIQYKFEKPFIDIEKGEQIIVKKKLLVIDGLGYQVFVQNGKLKNSFSFNSPEAYLKRYPKVDELISYNELLSIIKEEFSL
ncbi:hypothetical protein C8C83_2181 [Flavobacterium sp. 90]|uniref:hypothetical protein n=1 Tax=unclassified Flavobacterium TaxID=196869 RepID=UPI000EB066B1|nr:MULTISPECIES: hypothetical protein [unclassified Flavobacterium]RKR10505.1 hypothetical protein C8C82_2484 [Flavobacterium sp. 81]TCK54290.1 hypothetical protein C8C83_2181 [Flavobacterium sp. 90]